MTDYDIISKLRGIYEDFEKKLGDAIRCNLKISLSNRFETKAGSCTGKGFNNYEIKLSRKLLNEFGYKRIETTFRHELAHIYCFKLGEQDIADFLR